MSWIRFSKHTKSGKLSTKSLAVHERKNILKFVARNYIFRSPATPKNPTNLIATVRISKFIPSEQ